MSGVRVLTVGDDEGEVRLDRWFRRHFPGVPQVHLQKLLRTGQVRVDGRRAKPGDRVAPGQAIRVPPLVETTAPAAAQRRPVSDAERAMLRGRVLVQDADVIVIDKPAGLAVQGGSKTEKHLDGMLDALTGDARERPRLVHRLDRDTSGVLVLARNAASAERLAAAFRGRDARKVYWAVTVGVPKPARGIIDLALAKQGRRGEEKATPDGEAGKKAVTAYAVLATVGRTAALVALWPRTGRTHQLRAHMAAIGTPILGDAKYGGEAAFLDSLSLPRQLHLHAREIALPHPSGRGQVRAEAPLPPHFARTLKALNLTAPPGDPFAELA